MENEKKKRSLIIGKIFDIISFGLDIISFLGFTASAIIGCIKRNWMFAIPTVIFILIFIVIAICRKYNLFRKYNHRIASFVMNLFSPNNGYKLKEWKTVYEYLNEDNMKFHVEYEVDPLQSDVNFINVRYNWSGENETNPIIVKPIKNKGFDTKNLEEIGKEYGYKLYKLHSNNTYNKNDKPFKLGVKMDLSKKPEDPISHHLLTSISMKTENLRMIIKFPYSLHPTNIRKLEYLHSSDYVHWVSDNSYKAELDENNKWVIKWDVENPIYGGKYVIKWDIDNNTNI